MSDFIARTNESGIYGNPYWYDHALNPGATNYIWLPNCTTYAYGRSNEISGGQIDASTIFGGGFRNAALWYSESLWEKSPGLTDVRLGDILCWGSGGGVGSAGHVAIVEGIESGRIWLTESHDSTLSQTYSSPGTLSRRFFEYGYLDISTMVIHVSYWYNQAGSYDTHYSTIRVPNILGTIHNPYAGQTPGGNDKIIPILMLWKRRKERRNVRIYV